MSDKVVIHDFKKDYFPFEFTGFAQPGRCFLRVSLFNSNLAVLCVQPIKYHGTSITNGLESIVDKLVDTLLNEKLDNGKPVIEVIEKFPLWKRLTRSEQKAKRSRYLSARKKLLQRCRWFEYYPPDTGISKEGSLALVSVQDEHAPSWSYATPQHFENEYPKSFFIIEQDLSKWSST